jgi:hypothetical protein
MSYISAVVLPYLTFLNPNSGGEMVLTISHPESPAGIATPEFDNDLESDNPRQRPRSVARDWGSMPQAVRLAHGKFYLRGGKNEYTGDDLAVNILNRSTRSSRRHAGWNRHFVPVPLKPSNDENPPPCEEPSAERLIPRVSGMLDYVDFLGSERKYDRPPSTGLSNASVIIGSDADGEEIRWEKNPSVVNQPHDIY